MSDTPDTPDVPDAPDAPESQGASAAEIPPPPTPPRATETPTSERKRPRTWPQRLTITAAFAFAIGSFGAAGALYAGQRVIEARNVAPAIIDPSQPTTVVPSPGNDGTASGATTVATAPPETFPPAEPDAKNFLITGADNNSCVDPNSPFAPAFGDRSNFGERSDTIMMWRVNPSTSQVAVLSFPRDLFVDIAGSSRKGRINEAYQRDNPQKLIDTIYQNFGIVTDHYIQVDFCAFKKLVDAVGGVTVPFATPVRDTSTGLFVPEPGCFTFTGDHALAYVRSRHLQFYDENGNWKSDPTSDLGRISRQQDFLRRTVARLLAKGVYDPKVAGGLIDTLTQYVTTDGLTTRQMLEFAGVMSGVDPDAITTYQIAAAPKTIQGNAVLVPTLQNENMQSVLAIFRGQATLDQAPVQVLDTPTVPGAEPATTSAPESGTVPSAGVPDPAPGTTLPSVTPDENVFGVVPDKNNSC